MPMGMASTAMKTISTIEPQRAWPMPARCGFEDMGPVRKSIRPRSWNTGRARMKMSVMSHTSTPSAISSEATRASSKTTLRQSRRWPVSACSTASVADCGGGRGRGLSGHRQYPLRMRRTNISLMMLSASVMKNSSRPMKKRLLKATPPPTASEPMAMTVMAPVIV